MTNAGQPGVPPAAPLAALVLLGGLATVLIYLNPTALYGTAAGIALVCIGLLVAALVARRRAPRMEAPDPARIESWIRDAEQAGTRAAVESLLLRLGRWPQQLHGLDPGSCERVRRLVEEAESIETLEARLDPEVPWSQRVGALHLLSWLGLTDAEPLLIGALNDPDTQVASAAAAALARNGSEAALNALISALGNATLPPSRLASLLEDADPDVLLPEVAKHGSSDDPKRRFWMAHLAGRTGDSRALPLLLELSRDPDVDVVSNAAESLGRLGGETPRRRLHELLGHDSWVVRAHAARALGELGPEPSVTELTDRLHDSNWSVRENAVLALEKLDPAEVTRLIPILAGLRGTARTALEDVITNLRTLSGPAMAETPADHRP